MSTRIKKTKTSASKTATSKTGARETRSEPLVVARKTHAKPHPCVAQVNKALKPRGFGLITPIVLAGTATPIIIVAESIEGKKKGRMLLTANFCPFCGVEMSKL